MNGLLRMALGLADVPDLLIADLEKSTPEFERLAAAMRALEPIAQRAKPLFDQAAPILKQAYPDLIAILPTVEALIQFVNSKNAPK